MRILGAAQDNLVVVATHVPTKVLEHNVILIGEGGVLYTERIPGILSKLVTIRLPDGEGASPGQRLRSLQEALFEEIKQAP